jgi:tetratricopeptide (TPR) repeat protein
MKKYLFCLTVFIGAIACTNTDTPENRNVIGEKGGVKKILSDVDHDERQVRFSEEVINLNEQAVLLINERNQTSYQEAIKLLDKAIRIDSTYHMAYANKAATLSKLGKHIEAIQLYKYIVETIYPGYLEIYPMLGMLHEKMGKDSIAKEYYQMAILKYSDRINDKKDILDMINKAHIIYILNKQKGLNEIDSLIIAYPTNDELPLYKEYLFIGYDHKKYLEEL